MSWLSMVAFTHRRVPLLMLGQMAVRHSDLGGVLAAVRAAGYSEAVVLSTCSRTEVYAVGGDGPEGLLAVIGARSGDDVAAVRAFAEMREGHVVIDHLFRVSAGLDSRMVGEVEIHGQVRAALRRAQAAGMVGPVLSHLFPAALRCATKVHAETTLGALGRSLGRRAVEIGLASLEDVADPVTMVVGSGRMATTAVEHLVRHGRRPRVAARSDVHAARLAGPGLACPMSALTAGLTQVDLLICATSAAHAVVTLDHVRDAMATRARPLTVVDLSVPRNVDPAIAGVHGVRLIDLEGMDDGPVTDPMLAAALASGAALTRAAARRHAESLAARHHGAAIASLRRRVEEICLQRLSETSDPDGSDPDQLARSARSAAARLLHGPTVTFRAAVVAGDADALQSLCESVGVRVSEILGAQARAAQQRVVDTGTRDTADVA